MTARGSALIIGAGPGLGAALCTALVAEEFVVAAAARTPDAALSRLDRVRSFALDASDEAAVTTAADEIERNGGPLAALIYNAAGFHIGAFAETTPDAFEAVWRSTCLGAMIAARVCLPRMAARGQGAALFTGATASLRGGANFAAFASAKFALRGLVQSLSRSYWPHGVHVAHVVIDGMIGGQDGALNPAGIASAYVSVLNQPPSAWTQELDLRPHGERF